MQTFLRVLTVALLSLSVLFSALVLARNSLIYLFLEADLPPADMPRTEVRKIPAFGDDPALEVWLTRPEEGMPVVFYFMGNSGALSAHEARLRAFAEAGFGVAAMAYRGGAGQPGRPTQSALFHDAQRVYFGIEGLLGRELRDTERVIYGYSLGTAIAVQLAADQQELAVILEAPFPDLCTLAKHHYPLLPGCVLFRGEEYDTRARIDRIGAPLLVLHGNIDDVVPLEMGERVFAAAAEPKFMEVYVGGTHDNLGRLGAARDAIAFVQTLRGAR